MTDNKLDSKQKRRKTVTAPKEEQEQEQEELENGCADLNAQSALLKGALRCQTIQNRGAHLEIKSHHHHHHQQTRPYSDISSDENEEDNKSDDDDTSIHMENPCPIPTNRNRIFPSLLFRYHTADAGGIDCGAAVCSCTESVDAPCSSGLSISLAEHYGGNSCVGFGSKTSSHSCNLHQDVMECLACEERLCPICVRDFMK